MIRLASLALALGLSLPAPAAAQQNPQYQFSNYSVSFAPGQEDADGHFLGGTEIRDLVAFAGKLYAGNSYWMDQPGPEGKRTAQVLVLDEADGVWRQDVDFGDFCPPSNPKCALATGALAYIYFTRDKDGKAVSVGILGASIWPVGPSPQPIKVYARNNNDQKWYETVIASADNGQARSFGTHLDAVTGESLAFVMGGSIGIYHGWLSPKRGAGQNPIVWVTGEGNAEWNTSSVQNSPCGGAGKRIMGFAEAQGRLFATQCFDILVRTDGPQGECKPDEVAVDEQCQPRWTKFWTAPNTSNSESGLRGITAITYVPPGGASQQVLLVGYEGGRNGMITRVDPKTAESSIELDVTDTLTQAWQSPVGYIITSYSAPMPIWYGDDGRGRRIIGLHANINPGPVAPTPGHSFAMLDNGNRLEGEAWYFLRDKPYSYRLFKLPPIMTMRMQTVRAAVSSPFASDCNENRQNCAIYFGGFDAAKSATSTPCFARPCSVPPVPTHNTGFIVKGYFQ